MGIEAFRYDGKRVLVVGGASGIGAAAGQAAEELGAEVAVMDVAEVRFPVAQSIRVDLRDRGRVDQALDQLEGPIHAVFCCAGVADGTPGLMLINFVAQRHLVERLVTGGHLPRGSAVVMVSSVAGLGWQQDLATVNELLAIPDWEGAAAWVAAHERRDNYVFSKMAVNAYVTQRAFDLLRSGIRINAILPGPTDTPLARANADTWLTFGADYRAATGTDTLTPAQMANVMTFLGSEAASGITGVTLLVDAGQVSSTVAGSFEDPIVKLLLGTS